VTRQYCPDCLRPTPTCYCDLIPRINARTSLTVLQHPNEARHPKGTAALLAHSIDRATVVIGEQFCADTITQPQCQLVLLFPPSTEQRPAPNMLRPEQLEASSTQLLALDGTWRKTRRMLYQNPWLQNLPRLQLPALPSSRYRIRKAETAEQLSTLEACCYALMAIEGDQQCYQPLLKAFDQYIERLQQFIPKTKKTERK